MKTNYFTTKLFTTLTLLITCVLLFVSKDCKSQQANSDNNLVASINLNSFENNGSEQSLRQVKSEKIIKYLKLNLKERELLMEIKQLSTEAKECLTDADLVAKEIEGISKTIVNSTDMENDNLKIERKINRQENYELSIRYDAEELFEISNSLLFNIYENHFPSSGVLFAKNNKNQQQIIDLIYEAQDLFKNAIKNQDKANYDLSYKNGIDYLKKANFLKREAIKKYEQAYSLYYNIPINKNEYVGLLAELGQNRTNEKALNTDSLIKNSDRLNMILSSSVNNENNNEHNKLNEMIVYRVQIGAFTKKVNVKEFHGLYPLLEDKKDQKEYTKYMVGEYFSYKAASEAKRIIANTTTYKDAFIVAYKNDSRVIVNNELIK